MNLEQMEYISEVAKTRSISIAARHLHVTQAAVSQAINALEKEIGVLIFNRSRSGTLPTEQGSIVIEAANAILRNMEKIREVGRPLDSTYVGILRIAAVPSMFISLLPQALARFKKTFPKVHIHIHESGSQEILNDVLKDNIDLGLTIVSNDHSKSMSSSLQIRPILRGQMHVGVSKYSALASKREIFMNELQKYPVVMYGAENWNGFVGNYEKNIGKLNVFLTTSNSESLKQMISKDLAVGLLTDIMSSSDSLTTDNIILIPLTDYTPEFLSFGAISLKHKKSQLVDRFLDLMTIN